MLVTRQKLLRRFWYPVMPMTMLDAGPRPFTLLGEKIVLFKGPDGRPVALLDRCCHRTAELSKGTVENGNIVCGYHGWTYDATGKCVRIPQNTEASIPASAKVPAYRCDARYGYAWVALDEPVQPIFELTEATDPAYRQIDQFYEVWNCAGLRLMENSFDMAHLSFVHKGTFGPKSHVPRSMSMEASEWGLETNVETPVANPEMARNVVGSDAAETVRVMRGSWFLPFSRRLAISYPNGLRHTIITNATPIDDRSSMVVQWCYRSDTEAQVPAAEIIAFDRAVTNEDKTILESTDPDACIDTTRRIEFHMDSDKPGLIMREKLLALLREYGEEEVHG
ncbi:MAG: aromatic ring-hydroxylating dioxygenase subunit alpha [Proteobacteria bacterium]|nr:aromatic ring-hydroxylating dioxygenase subunit alpha [Burkholderiales bacterium]